MDTITIINLTPHEIIGPDGVVYPPDLIPVRVTMSKQHLVSCRCGVPIYSAPIPGDVIGLPDPAPDTYYLVSRIVKSTIPERDDCIVPDDMVRDNQGRVIGCRRLSL